jgi:hypothetical protein
MRVTLIFIGMYLLDLLVYVHFQSSYRPPIFRPEVRAITTEATIRAFSRMRVTLIPSSGFFMVITPFGLVFMLFCLNKGSSQFVCKHHLLQIDEDPEVHDHVPYADYLGNGIG